MGRYVEDAEDFYARHGGENAMVCVGRYFWLFPDGASIRGGDMLRGEAARHEPPADPLKRLRLRRQYWAEKLSRATRTFNRLKSSLMGSGYFTWNEAVAREYGPAPGRNGPAALHILKGHADAARQMLDAIDRELEQFPEVRAEAERKRHDAEQEALRAAESADQSAEVENITL